MKDHNLGLQNRQCHSDVILRCNPKRSDGMIDRIITSGFCRRKSCSKKLFVGLFCSSSKVCDTTTQVTGDPLQVCELMVLLEEGGRRHRRRIQFLRVQDQRNQMGRHLPGYPSEPSTVRGDKQGSKDQDEEGD